MFKALYPKLEIYMIFATSSQVEQLLQENVVELAIFSRKPKIAKLKCEPYATSAMVTACLPGHPYAERQSTLRELAREPLMLREPEASGGELVRSCFARKGLKIILPWTFPAMKR